MCENDSIGEKIDKPAVKTPQPSGASAGVSKIFILTPEILQKLGLAGFTTTRIASCDSSKKIQFNLPTLQGIQASADQKEGNKNVITLGKLLEGNVVNTALVKKPRRDSATENSNDLGESSKSLISTEAQQRLNGEEKEKTVTSIKAKGRSGLTLSKAKNVKSCEIKKSDYKKSLETKNDSKIITSTSTTPIAKTVRRKNNSDKFASNETQESDDKKNTESEIIPSIGSTTPKAKNSRRKITAPNLPSTETRELDKKNTESKNESEETAIVASTTPKAKNSRRKSTAPNLPSTETRELNEKNTESKNESEETAIVASTTPKAKNVRRKSSVVNLPSTETQQSNEEKNIQPEEIALIDSTAPKAKTPRRKSNAKLSTSERRDSSDKNTLEAANKPETPTVGVRTSKRVAKPKKFDDFILTENLSSYGRDRDNKSEKSRSRRSSVNSDSTQPVSKNKKNGKAKQEEKSEATDLVSEIVEKKINEKKDSNDVKAQSSSENCFAVPEPPTTVRKKLFDKSHEKQIPKTATVNEILGSKEKTPPKKGAEVANFTQTNSETKNSLPLQKDVFLVPKSPTSVGKKKSPKAHESGSIIQYLVRKSPTDPESRVAETTLKKGMEKEESGEEKPKLKPSVSRDTADSDSVEEEKKTLMKENEILVSEQQKSERLQEVATTLKKTDEISVFDQRQSESIINECNVKNSVNSRDERENVLPVAEPLSSSELPTEISVKMTKSSDEKNKAPVAKAIVQGSLDDKKETTASSPNLSEEKIIASKSDIPRSVDRNETTSSLEISEPNSQNDKNDLDSLGGSSRISVENEVCTSKIASSETKAKNEVISGSKQHSPRSRHLKQTASSLKLYLLKPLEKKREISSSKPDPLKSLETKLEANSSKSDKVKFPEKEQKEVKSLNSDSLKPSEKKEQAAKSSNSDSLKPSEKKEQAAKSSNSELLKTPEKKEQAAKSSNSESLKPPEKEEQAAKSSNLELLKPPEKKEKAARSLNSETLKPLEKKQKENESLKADTLKSPEKEQKEAKSSVSESLKSPEKEQEETKSLNSESLKPLEKKQKESKSLKADTLKSPENEQTEAKSSVSESLKSPEKEQDETNSLNSELLKPLEKKQQEANSSKSDPLKPLEKDDKTNNSKSDPLQFTYKKEKIRKSLFDPPSSPETVEKIEKVLDILCSQDEEEKVSETQLALQKSPNKKEIPSSSSFVLEPPNKKQRSTNSRLALPTSTDKKEKFINSNITLPRSPEKEEKDTEINISEPVLSNCSTSIQFPDIRPIQAITPDTTKVDSIFRFDAASSSDKIECTENIEPTSPLEVHSELFSTEMDFDSMSDSDGDNTAMSIMNEKKDDDESISSKYIENDTEGLSTSRVESQNETELFNIEMEHYPMHKDKNANTEIPLLKESLRIEDTEIPIDKPLNNTSEAIEVGDEICTPKTRNQRTETQPVRTYSRRRKSQQAKMPESPHVLVTDISIETANTTVDETSVENTPRRKRRVPKNDDLVADISIETANTTVDETSVENTPRRKRRVPKNDDVTDGKGLSDGSDDDADKNQVRTRRRGRPSSVINYGPSKGRLRGRGRRRVEVDTEYVPRVSSASKEKTKVEDTVEIDNSEKASAKTETVESPQVSSVECGKCNEQMEKKNWIKHNLAKHNNMGWLVGSPKPDWDNDVKLLRNILTLVLKKKKKTQLICEICGVGKRSANGFISHVQFCGKTDDERISLMMTCPLCGHVMMPSSWEWHERTHRQDDKAMKENKKEETAAVTPSGRGKRKAAEKAATKISEFTNSVKDDEPATKKQRTKEEMGELIEKPRSTGNAPNRFKGMWKIDIAKNGKAMCRHQGCTFETDSFEAICNHHPECSFAPRSNWVCKLCLFSSLTEEEALQHVETEHSTSRSRESKSPDSDFENSNSSDSSDEDSESSRNDKRITFKKDDRYQTQEYNVKFLDEEVKVDTRWPFTFPPALRWTMEFESKNYRLRLFEDLSPNNMRLLEHKESLEYLPELSVSMKVKISDSRNSTSARWTQWERFEGTVFSGSPTCFVGGPVWAIAWLPIPAPMYNQSPEQFVAISTHSTMESDYEVGKSYVGNNIIQIWNLGPLDHSKSSHSAPILSYGVAHDKGTIWCMEWCPSGCYEDSTLFEPEVNTTTKRRMGLLAAACSDGCVHVFSLPFPEELEFSKDSEDSQLPIYETKPIFTLTIDVRMYDQGEQNWQCTKLNWSKELGHDTIIAGFSNGHVAIWDLGSKTPLFVTTRGETTFIDAFHHFYAHGHAISAVQLIPYGGKRFFITSSYDRMTKLWDLEDTNYPLTALKRGVAVDGSWFTHWPAYATAYDDVLAYAHTYLLALRQQGPKIFPLLPTNSTTYSVTTSDYGNSIGHGTLAGDVVVMFPNYMWTYKDMERLSYKKRWLASTIEVVDFEREKSGMKRKKPPKTYEYMPETYDGCKDRYGLVFRDKLNRAEQHIRNSGSKNPLAARLKPVNVEQYPFASANRVSWNPNAWSYLWMCVAYQNGVVRFLNFKAVALDKELRKLLPSHAKTMLQNAKTLETKSRTNFATSDLTVSQEDS